MKESLKEFAKKYPNDYEIGKQFRALIARYTGDNMKDRVKNSTELEKVLAKLEATDARVDAMKALYKEMSDENGEATFSVKWMIETYLNIK